LNQDCAGAVSRLGVVAGAGFTMALFISRGLQLISRAGLALAAFVADGRRPATWDDPASGYGSG
jgi:hypothetical protein